MHKSGSEKVYVANPEVVTVLGSGESFWNALCRGDSGLSTAAEAFPNWFPGDTRYVGALTLTEEPTRFEQILDRVFERIDPKLFFSVEKIYIATSLGDLIGPYAGKPQRPIQKQLEQLDPKLSAKTMIVSSACSSGSDALSLGFLALKSGAADSALVIAADSLCPAKLAHHIALGTQSPGRCRPFDPGRDGTSFSEGGASLLLATAKGLSKLGCEPIVEVTGVGFSCDGYDITAPDPSGRWAAAAITHALPKNPGSIYVNAHGTGTLLNDQAEAKALQSALDLSRCWVSSTKGAIGHSLGATGLVEAIVAILSLARGKIPGTTGNREADSSLSLQIVRAGNALNQQVDQSLSVTFGFGGVNSAAFFQRI